jgi:small-conductance mechanosensitive channel
MPGFQTALSGIISSVHAVFSSLLNRMIFAAVVLLVGFVAGRLLGNFVRYTLREMGLDNILRSTGIKMSLEKILGAIVTYATYFIALVMALDMLGLDTIVLNVLAGAVILALVISALLAVRDFIPNLFAGLVMRRKNMVREGDNVEISDIRAKVLKTDLMEVKLQTDKGDTIFFPNSLFIKKKLVRKRR